MTRSGSSETGFSCNDSKVNIELSIYFNFLKLLQSHRDREAKMWNLKFHNLFEFSITFSARFNQGILKFTLI